ncbi:uncharacterized protein LOC131876665 [Cryptomeria japonica]|uniref:uncharacterized protein LOC131876665 n=1 Tax=Cryptomeria japonica TaxID=3369 RepID=UPI0027DA69B6|nr:uncharacterized protein LOC131876665 [Cryptomeria japonica]
MVCTRPDIAHVVGVVSRYMSNPGLEHWNAVKWVLRLQKVVALSTTEAEYVAATEVFVVLEISKDRFMTLVREGALQIYKENIQYVQYFKKHMDMLHPKEIEALVQYMQKIKLKDSEVLPPRTGEKGTCEQ